LYLSLDLLELALASPVQICLILAPFSLLLAGVSFGQELKTGYKFRYK